MTAPAGRHVAETLDVMGKLADAWAHHGVLDAPMYASPVFEDGRETIDGKNIAAALRQARAVFVAADMVTLWTYAARSFSDEHPLVTAELFEARGGFAWLEEPAVNIGEEGISLVQGLHWAAVPYRDRPCILVVPYYARRVPRRYLDKAHKVDMELGIDPPTTFVKNDPPQGWPVTLAAPGAFTIAPLNEQTQTSEALDWARVLWALCHQRVAVTDRQPVDRHTARRAARAGIEHVPDVQVIRLRHPTLHNHEHETSPVDWSHRWIVGGHWRNQWLPSEQRHAPRWIAPYVKGPVDKPLVMTRAYELIR